MAAIAVKTPTLAGTGIGYASASAGGDYITNDGQILVFFRNTSGASRTVSHTPPNPPQAGLTFDTIDMVIADGGIYVAGPFNPKWHNDENGRTQFTYSSEAGVTVSATRIGV